MLERTPEGVQSGGKGGSSFGHAGKGDSWSDHRKLITWTLLCLSPHAALRGGSFCPTREGIRFRWSDHWISGFLASVQGNFPSSCSVAQLGLASMITPAVVQVQ